MIDDKQQNDATQATQTQEPTSPFAGAEPTAQDAGQTITQQAGVPWANDPILGQFKTPEELAKAYLELHKKIGENNVVIPETPEGKLELLKKLGLPEDPKAYPDVEVGKELFETEEAFNEFKAIAQQIGLLPEQFEKLVQGMYEIIKLDEQMTVEERKELTNQLLGELQRRWGSEYEAKMKHIQRVFKTLPEDTKKKIIEAGLDLDLGFIEFLDKISQFYKEDSLTYAEYSVDDARRELQRILNDRNHPYFNREHPQHDEAVQKVQQLYRIIYGT